jgi:O-antigen ligase
MAYLLIPILLLGQERNLTRMLPVFFVLGTALSEAIGIASTFFFSMHDTINLLGDGFITGNQRLGSMAGQPNPNGAVIAFSLPMLIYTLVKGSMPKLVGLVCGLTLLWGLMLSASFTGFFASMVAIGVTLALIGLRHVVRLGLVLAVAAGMFFASGAPLPKAFQERVGGAVETGDISQAGTFLNRSELITEAWGFAEDTAVIGMGVDRYRELSHHDNPVHNLHLLIWNEGGAIAFLGLVGLLAMLGALAAGGLRHSREEGGMACAIVIVFLIYTSSYPHMYSRMWVVPIFIALGIIYGRRDHQAPVNGPPTSAKHPSPPMATRYAPQA